MTVSGVRGEDARLTSQRCPIGPLNLHTMNHERTECIWCGPGRLAWKPGHWVSNGDGTDAWSAAPLAAVGVPADQEARDER